jgi:hypothetical protein
MRKSHSQFIIGSSEHNFKRVILGRSQVIRVKEAAWTLGVAPNSTGGARIAGKNLRQGSNQSSVARGVLRCFVVGRGRGAYIRNTDGRFCGRVIVFARSPMRWVLSARPNRTRGPRTELALWLWSPCLAENPLAGSEDFAAAEHLNELSEDTSK